MPVPLCRSNLPAQTTPAMSVGAGVANLMGSGFSRSGLGDNDREEDRLLLPVIPVPALSTLRLSETRLEPFAGAFRLRSGAFHQPVRTDEPADH